MSKTETTPITHIFYRYHDQHYDSGSQIDLLKFVGIKQTPKGWWIVPESDYRQYVGQQEIYVMDEEMQGYIDSKKKWVSLNTTKRFAYPTKVQAMDNFLARKRSQLGFLRRNVENITTILDKCITLKASIYAEMFKPEDFRERKRISVTKTSMGDNLENAHRLQAALDGGMTLDELSG